MTHARLVCRSLLATLALAAVARADPPSPAEHAVLQAASAVGRRTVAVAAEGHVTYAADQFAVEFTIDSGTSAPDEADAKLVTLLGNAQDTLRTAGLPQPTPATDAARVEPSGVPGKVIARRRYTVAATDADQARAVRQALAPMVGPQQVTTEKATIASLALSFSSAKLRADPNAALAAARADALAHARAVAEGEARVLGVRLGPPVSVGVLTVNESNSDTAGTRGFFASGTVVFELLD